MRTPAISVALSFLIAQPAAAASSAPGEAAWTNRLTWGASGAPAQGAMPGSDRWLNEQLKRPDDTLPPAIAEKIAAMRISLKPMAALVVEQEAAIRAVNALTDTAQKDAARKAYQQSMGDLANEAATRSLLRDIYAPDQLREQMTWFWFNHFNVQAQKADIRAMVGDYEETIRAHAFGKFRDLLEATLKHPAMLRYLDNAQNAVGHINENYAREIMELHTMGVGSGYTQGDVQQLAHILTGVGVNTRPDNPKLPPAKQALYLRAGLFEFNPNRHDFGDKQFMGQTIKGSGFAEVEQALDLISKSPATAQHVSEQIATYFMGDTPPPALVDRMAAAWRHSDGDIAQVMRTMIRSSEFKASLGTAFKDPVHYTVSAVRVMYGGRPILNTQPIIGWLNRMGEGLYAHETPDGYPMSSAAWTGPGQMSVRFEIARQIGGNRGILFAQPAAPAPAMMTASAETMAPPATTFSLTTTPPPAIALGGVPLAAPPLPQLQKASYYTGIADALGGQTKSALTQAVNPAQWNALFLSSPEFMRR